MDKIYQVFISSTFEDLKTERRAIVDILLKTKCMPAGMELFVAADEEQFSVIKEVIDFCDYFVLIIGNRYGTINLKENKSYTEMEYDYARAKKIPILVFDVSKFSDKNIDNKNFLENFKKKAMVNVMAAVVNDINELKIEVMNSIHTSTKNNPKGGWIRGTEFTDDTLKDKLLLLQVDKDLLIRDVEVKYNENKLIKAKNLQLKVMLESLTLRKDLWFYNDKIDFNDVKGNHIMNYGIDEIYKYISMYLTYPFDYVDFEHCLKNFFKCDIDDFTKRRLIMQYEELGLFMPDEYERYHMTEIGRNIKKELNLYKDN